MVGCWPWVAVNTEGLDWEKVNREIGIKSLIFWGKLGFSQHLGMHPKQGPNLDEPPLNTEDMMILSQAPVTPRRQPW